MYFYGTFVALVTLSTLLAGRACAQTPENGQQDTPAVWQQKPPNAKNFWWTMTRDMTVPAPCWRAPWITTDPRVVPKAYFRDRFLLDWTDRDVPPGKKFYLSIYVETAAGKKQHNTNIKPITNRKALVGINKYANDALMVYFDDELAEGGPETNEPGMDDQSAIIDCNGSSRPGCWAISLPPSDQIIGLHFSVHADDWPLENTYGDEPYALGINPLPTGEAPNSRRTNLVLCDQSQVLTSSLPPMRRMMRRTIGAPQAQATDV